MGQIFLSYAREDRACAEVLARTLGRAGHDVWWDQRIDSGEEFAAEIEAALAHSDVVLVAWSKNSVTSRWVRDEAAVGGDGGRLVPVSMDGIQPPMGFRQFHTLDLTGWKGAKRDARTAELLHSVERRMSAPKTAEAAAAPAEKPRRWRAAGETRTMWTTAVAAVLLAIMGAGLWLWTGHARQGGPPTKPTLALLAFTTASPDPQLRQLASEARDSLSNTLSQNGIPVKLLGSVPEAPNSTGDYRISGNFSRNGDKVVGTLHLDETAHGVTLTSYRFEAAGDDVRNLPERIGVQVAANLSWSGPLMILDRRHHPDPALVAQLMQGNNYLNDFLQRYQNAKQVAAKAPDLRDAQISVAYYTSFVLDAFPIGQRAAAVADARRASDKARALDPSLGDIEGSWCFLHSDALLRDCEDHLRAGIARSPDDNWLMEFLASVLAEVGRFDEAAQLQQLSYTHDPYAPIKIGHMLQMLEFTGATDEANQLGQDGARWWPEFKQSFVRSRLMGLLYRGDFQAIGRFAQRPESEDLPLFKGSAAIISAVQSKSVPALRRACGAAANADAGSGLSMVQCLVALNSLGDEASAFALAEKMYPRRLGRNSRRNRANLAHEPGRRGGIAASDLIDSCPDAARPALPATGAAHGPARLLAQRADSGLLPQAAGADLRATAEAQLSRKSPLEMFLA